MPSYIVPTSVNVYNAERLAAAALVLSSDYWSDYRKELAESSHELAASSVNRWDVCERTGHQSQTFVPMKVERGGSYLIRYNDVIFDCVVQFDTCDATCPLIRDGYFVVFTTFRDGTSDTVSVPASDCMDLVCEWDEVLLTLV